MPRQIRVFAGRTGHFYWFCHAAAHIKVNGDFSVYFSDEEGKPFIPKVRQYVYYIILCLFSMFRFCIKVQSGTAIFLLPEYFKNLKNQFVFDWIRLLVHFKIFTCLCIPYLSYDVAVIRWIMSCHKNRMTTRYITLGYWRVTSWCRPWQRYVFFWNTKGDKIPLKQAYDKQNLTLVVISYEIYETRQRLVSYTSYEMTTHVRSSIFSSMSQRLTRWAYSIPIVHRLSVRRSSIVHTFKLQYLWSQLANLDQIL